MELYFQYLLEDILTFFARAFAVMASLGTLLVLALPAADPLWVSVQGVGPLVLATGVGVHPDLKKGQPFKCAK